MLVRTVRWEESIERVVVMILSRVNDILFLLRMLMRMIVDMCQIMWIAKKIVPKYQVCLSTFEKDFNIYL